MHMSKVGMIYQLYSLYSQTSSIVWQNRCWKKSYNVTDRIKIAKHFNECRIGSILASENRHNRKQAPLKHLPEGNNQRNV